MGGCLAPIETSAVCRNSPDPTQEIVFAWLAVDNRAQGIILEIKMIATTHANLDANTDSRMRFMMCPNLISVNLKLIHWSPASTSLN